MFINNFIILREIIILNNSISDYLYFVVSFFVLWFVFFFVRVQVLKVLKHISEKTKNIYDDLFVFAIESIKKPIYLFFSFYISISLFLTTAKFVNVILLVLFYISIIYLIIKSISLLGNLFLNKMSKKMGGKNIGFITAAKSLGSIGKVVLWLFGLIILLSNLGVDVTALLAGFGIGGLAFVFAFKKILADLFSAFVIFSDNPFTLGDSITVGKTSGTVERIGLKTCTLRSYNGETIVIPNGKLTTSVVQNFTRLEKRRSIVDISVSRGTSNNQLFEIPQILEKIIERIDGVEFTCANLKEFEESSALIRFIFFVNSPTFEVFCDKKQEVLLSVIKEFKDKGIKDTSYKQH